MTALKHPYNVAVLLMCIIALITLIKECWRVAMWKREHRRKLRIYEECKAQWDEALFKLHCAKTDEEYEEAIQENIIARRRYEHDVLGFE